MPARWASDATPARARSSQPQRPLLTTINDQLQSMEAGRKVMAEMPLYPLRFEPIYQYRLWGGRRLPGLLSTPLPGDGPIGEAWVLSDRDDHQSKVSNGPLKGRTMGDLMEHFRGQLMGKLAPRFRRFPLLLKFLDAHEILSVQVHHRLPGRRPTSAILRGGFDGRLQAPPPRDGHGAGTRQFQRSGSRPEFCSGPCLNAKAAT